MDGIDFNATEDDTEDIENNENEDDGEGQSFPHSSTTENDRPSTITEVSLLVSLIETKCCTFSDFYFLTFTLSRQEKLIKSAV